jgi:hypothetical protein
MTIYLCDDEDGNSVFVIANSWKDAEAKCETRNFTLFGEYMGEQEFDAEIFE